MTGKDGITAFQLGGDPIRSQKKEIKEKGLLVIQLD